MNSTGVTTTIGDDVVLHRLRLAVRPGTCTVLLGSSGSGKTTLIRHLVGLLPPDSGSVEIGGRSVWELDPEELRRLRAGFGVLLGGSTLFEPSLFGSLDVFGNVAHPLRRFGLGEDSVGNRVRWWLRRLDLDDLVDRMPHELAAHTRRRVALAKALVADPPLAAVVAAERASRRRMVTLDPQLLVYVTLTFAAVCLAVFVLTRAIGPGGL